MLGLVGVGARDEHPPTGDVRERGPHLLAVDDPLVTVADGPGREARDVGAGAGLAEELAPDLLVRRARPEEALLLLLRAPREQRRAAHADADDVEGPWRLVAGQHVVHVLRLPGAQRQAGAVLGRPRRGGVARLAHELAPRRRSRGRGATPSRRRRHRRRSPPSSPRAGSRAATRASARGAARPSTRAPRRSSCASRRCACGARIRGATPRSTGRISRPDRRAGSPGRISGPNLPGNLPAAGPPARLSGRSPGRSPVRRDRSGATHRGPSRSHRTPRPRRPAAASG